MKVRVAYTVDIDDAIRRQINAWYGRPGLASRKEIQRWYEANGHSMDDDLSFLASEQEAKEAGIEAADEDADDEDETVWIWYPNKEDKGARHDRRGTEGTAR